jgi:hypothetical protein
LGHLNRVYAHYVRLIGTEPDGWSDFLVPGRLPVIPSIRACLRALPPSLRDETRRRYEQIAHGLAVCLLQRGGPPLYPGQWSCVLIPSADAGYNLATWGIGGQGQQMFGLVPDGVARVLLRYSNEPPVSIPVHNNALIFHPPYYQGSGAPSVPGVPSPPMIEPVQPSQVQWVDNLGRVLQSFAPPQPGEILVI